uniref:PID domain-containing protein n=1 Tax=Rhodnius prolixus TaxID=13249 RepID=T1HNA2_RHOPR
MVSWISYCSADATYGHVFAFIATDDDDILQCHAFLCQKRKMAQLISITVAQTFNTAFHLWQMSHTGIIPHADKAAESLFSSCIKSADAHEQSSKRPQSVIQQVLAPIPMLIDLTTPIEQKPPKNWTSFED